ncbi:MAG: B12-binding domain-containing radical SAM protein [Deltaproteobacteria bacterium]|nr:B12-binding domain-containing radical SAM protein [Deltaproteobacteria bacterium]
MHYEGMLIRPPSEANSILLQATVGCSHNICTFCVTYKDKRFRIKDNETLMSDLRFASHYCKRQDRLFIMDGDALIMPQERLVRLLDNIREMLPWVRRVGLYANAKSVRMKTDEELNELRGKGLGIAYYGVESGDGDTLKRIQKGSTPETLIEQGQRLKRAGIKLSVTVLLGIAGRSRSLEHARATGALLTEMDPDYVGALTVIVIPGTELWEEQQRGAFEIPDVNGFLTELREMIAHTHLTGGLFFSNHASNYLPVKARLPQDREKTLALIDRALVGEVELKPEWMRAL